MRVGWAIAGLAAGAGAAGAQPYYPANGHSYELTPTRMSWHDAEAYARSRGGHLATVRDSQENIWIHQHVNAGVDYYVWLGARDSGTQSWAWVSGEPFGFASWFPPCPVNAPSETHVGLIVIGSETGGWCNLSGNELWRGVVETCYANCDGSTAAPSLNVADLACFLQRFAAGEPYANCDGSVQPPALNVADLTCFLRAVAAGCS